LRPWGCKQPGFPPRRLLCAFKRTGGHQQKERFGALFVGGGIWEAAVMAGRPPDAHYIPRNGSFIPQSAGVPDWRG